MSESEAAEAVQALANTVAISLALLAATVLTAWLIWVRYRPKSVPISVATPGSTSSAKAKVDVDSTPTKKKREWGKTALKVLSILAFLAALTALLLFGLPALLDGLRSFTTSGSSTTSRLEEVYDLFVPARGCSETIENTNPRLWVDPKPKNPATGWPRETQMVTPSSRGWVPYQTGARYSHLRYCNNGREMWMTIQFFRGQL